MFIFQSKYRNFDTVAAGKNVLFRDYRYVTESEDVAKALRSKCGPDFYEVTPGHIQLTSQGPLETPKPEVKVEEKRGPGRPKVVRGSRTSELET